MLRILEGTGGVAAAQTCDQNGMADIGHGAHVFCLYYTDEQHIELASSLVANGLDHGEKVLYLSCTRSFRSMESLLKETVPDFTSRAANGQVRCIFGSARTISLDKLDPKGIISVLSAEADRALADGYPSLRVITDLPPVDQLSRSENTFAEFEEALDDFLQGTRCLCFCLYDHRYSNPVMLGELLCMHPQAMVNVTVYKNLYYSPPMQKSGSGNSESCLDWRLRSLAARGNLDDERNRLLNELGAEWARLAVENARLYRESQQATRARDEFISVASHELKTPITSLRGFAQLTLRQLEKSDGFDVQRVRRALEIIDQQSVRLAELVSQLLDISRIEGCRLSLNREITDVGGLIDSVVKIAGAKGTRHALNVRAPAGVLGLVDPLRLEQVITNLIDNAIKYSPEGGAVEIELEADGDWISISVTDHGIGITPEHRQHIFDRYYQAHASHHYGGMGLGLYISREIVSLHGGQIRVESPDQGSTRFVVCLPARLTEGSLP